MDMRRMFLLGVFGGVLMTLTLGIARALGLPLNLELLLGTLVGVEPGIVAWLVGLGLHLGISGLIGLVYGWCFKHLPPHHAGWDVGMLYALVHVFIAGTLLGFVEEIHPLVPRFLEEPGPFYAGRGLLAVLFFVLVTLLYGAVVGEGAARGAGRARAARSGGGLRRRAARL